MTEILAIDIECKGVSFTAGCFFAKVREFFLPAVRGNNVVILHVDDNIVLLLEDVGETGGQDYKRFSSMSRCSTHNLCSEMT